MKLISKLGLASSVLFLGASAFAASGNIAYDARFDIKAVDNDKEKTGKVNQTVAQMSRFRLLFTGAATDTITYDARLRFDKATAATKVDATTDLVDFATISNKLNDVFTLTVGKLSLATGGIENSYNGADIYLYSQANGEVSGSDVSTGGARVKFVSDAHILIAEAFNADPTSTNANTTQTDMGLGAQYWGNFGPVKGVASYHYLNQPNTAGKNPKNTFLNIGAQAKFSEYVFDVDYLVNTFEDKTTAGKDDKTTSIVGRLAYVSEHFRPNVKVVSEQTEVSGTDYYKRLAYSVALEYYPEKAANFRYHVAYTSSDTDFEKEPGAGVYRATADAGKKDNTVQTIFLGVRLASTLF